MGSNGRNPRTVHFGDCILDLDTAELRRNGTKTTLQDQPFQILTTLLENPGRLVTREQLTKRLWPAGTFVDFDQSLNKAVARLRDALGDNAERPTVVETLPRKGYRFIAPVTSGNETHYEEPSAEAPGLEYGASLRKSWISISVGSLLIAAAIGGYLYAHRTRKLVEKDTIVLADFTNSTGDPVFDNTLKTALTVSLRQSPFLNSLSDGKVSASLRMMALPTTSVVTPTVAREVCRRANGKAYITGSITQLGSQYVVGLKAVNCESEDVLAEEQATARTKENVLQALGDAASKLRTELGESLATVHKFDAPLAEATTSSLEALKAYSLGEQAFREKSVADAIPFHKRAIELDPGFALAYLAVGEDYYSLSEEEKARGYYSKAFDLREHASDRERLTITAAYYTSVTGEQEKAAEAYRQLIGIYPRDFRAYLDLGDIYDMVGQLERGLEFHKQSLSLSPDNIAVYGNVAFDLLALQRFDEAGRVIQQAQSLNTADFYVHEALYALSFLAADGRVLTQESEWFTGKPEESFGLSLASDSEAYIGRLTKARQLTNQAVESAIRFDSREAGAIWQEIAAQREAAFGNLTEAKRAATRGLLLNPDSESAAVEAALAFAMAGEGARTESLIRSLSERFPFDTQLHSQWLPAIQAQLALNRNNSSIALSTLRPAAPVEFGEPMFTANNSCLYAIYIRGEAYLAAGDGANAAAEFQKILDHNGLVWNCWTGALAHLGVARSNALQSRTSHGADAYASRERALAAYKDFFTLWKDADPDIPILKRAKGEYAKLQ